MRRVWIGIGLMILIAGLIAGVLGNIQTNTSNLTTSQPGAMFTASGLLLGAGSVSVTRTGAPANATFGPYQCSSPSCSSPRSIATGSGPGGTSTSTATNGETFQIQLTGPTMWSRNVSATIA